MRNSLAITLFILGIFASPFFLFAQEDSASLIADIQAQIAALQARIKELQVSGSVSLPPPAGGFTRDFFRGSEGDDVRNLQQFLSQFPDVYPEGLTTGYFGHLTEKAVQRWQAREGIVSFGSADTTGYGRVGPKTRAKLNALMVSSENVVVSSPLPIAPIESVAEESATTTPLLDTTIATTSPEVAPEGVAEKPAPDIKSGTGTAATGSAFGFGTGAIHYKELGKLSETGALYLGTAGGGKTSPPLLVANMSAAKGSACDPYDAVALPEAIGPSTICDVTDAANYTFSSAELARFHEKSSSCYAGIILFRQNGLYGGIEPEDVTKEGHLTYRYWYDASGGSDFSSVCLLGKKKMSPAFASVLHSLTDVLEKIKSEIKKLPR